MHYSCTILATILHILVWVSTFKGFLIKNWSYRVLNPKDRGSNPGRCTSHSDALPLYHSAERFAYSGKRLYFKGIFHLKLKVHFFIGISLLKLKAFSILWWTFFFIRFIFKGISLLKLKAISFFCQNWEKLNFREFLSKVGLSWKWVKWVKWKWSESIFGPLIFF